MLDNKKLAKELANVYASSNKAIQTLKVELAKIDEKYRKLAEEEKKKLNETLKVLETKLEYFGGVLSLDDAASKKDEDVTTAVQVEEEDEGTIEDTLFPENNDEVAEEAPEDESGVTDEPHTVTAGTESVTEEPADEYSDIWPAEEEAKSDEDEEKEQSTPIPEAEEEEEEEEWPEQPEEWN